MGDQLIETMNLKRRSSPRTKQQPPSAPKGSQPSASSLGSGQPLSVDVGLKSSEQAPNVEASDVEAFNVEASERAAERAEAFGEVRQIQGEAVDWQRWDNLVQQIEGQPQAEQLKQFLNWAETQAASLDIEADSALSEGELFRKVAALASQLLIAMNRLTAQAQQQAQQQQALNETLVQVLQTVTSGAPLARMAATTRRSASGVKGNFTEFDSKELKKSHAKGSADEKLNRAFNAIVSHNDAGDRSNAEKWAINQNALAELTGCNRPAIKQFLKEHGAEIEAHHQIHQILPRHNYSHGKNGIKITDVIRW
ncbi:MAG: hypothetical protein MH252_00015 [Thermosynechococcaceae cyanobacterium MS004]|nr:hypothetical protein [Thermosynechococcaceae cyanobacterium MS004]